MEKYNDVLGIGKLLAEEQHVKHKAEKHKTADGVEAAVEPEDVAYDGNFNLVPKDGEETEDVLHLGEEEKQSVTRNE
jgi:hypothetical protein